MGWKDLRVFVTGVCGTVGAELVKQLMQEGVGEVVGIDNNESELFFQRELYRDHANVDIYLGDMLDRDLLVRRMQGANVVLHAAANKHVELCERSPASAIQTNILGTQRVIDAAFAAKVSKVVFTSSDKAVNPTNVMGTSKLMGERLMTAANAQRSRTDPVFASTRFGNVLGSRGSVIPLFRQQIARGGPVTVTHPDMTRFIMGLEQAVRLVLDSVFLAHGGEVLVTKMPVVRIADLAEVMVEELGNGRVEIVNTCPKAGEKLYEELTNDEEVRRTRDLGAYLAVLPAFRSMIETVSFDDLERGAPLEKPYNSRLEPAMSKDEIRRFLHENRLL